MDTSVQNKRSRGGNVARRAGRQGRAGPITLPWKKSKKKNTARAAGQVATRVKRGGKKKPGLEEG